MLKKEQQAYIVHQVNLHNKVLPANLNTTINISHDTIRRDLQELSEKGRVIKVHGGALLHAFNNIACTTNTNKYFNTIINKRPFYVKAL
jgi:DeoR/GlpR family transcriptional regulator of sugar metabolism